MKRTNVMLDEDLLERARRALGEKTYSGAITKALEEVVRQEKFWELYRQFEHLAHTEGVFDPEYIKEKMAKSFRTSKRRISAHDARAPRKQKKPDGSRR
jgi:hypothetical protein